MDFCLLILFSAISTVPRTMLLRSRGLVNIYGVKEYFSAKEFRPRQVKSTSWCLLVARIRGTFGGWDGSTKGGEEQRKVICKVLH